MLQCRGLIGDLITFLERLLQALPEQPVAEHLRCVGVPQTAPLDGFLHQALGIDTLHGVVHPGTQQSAHFVAGERVDQHPQVVLTHAGSRGVVNQHPVIGMRLAGQGVTARAVHPGVVATNFGKGPEGRWAMRVMMTALGPVLKKPADGAAPIVLILNNGSYGTIRMHQERHYPGRVSGTALANPDFAALARALAEGAAATWFLAETDPQAARKRWISAMKPRGEITVDEGAAKALANGLPIGAMLSRKSIATAFGPGTHASTFGGTPIVTAAAMEVCKILMDDGVVAKGRAAGVYFKEQLLALKDRYAEIEDIRGRGLLLGMKLKIDGAPIVRQCLQNGFLINCIQDRILRFIPPLIISIEEIDQLIDYLDKVLGEAAAS